MDKCGCAGHSCGAEHGGLHDGGSGARAEQRTRTVSHLHKAAAPVSRP